MANKTFNTMKWFKGSLIGYAAIILVGLILAVVIGPKFDINFVGGARISYSYAGELNEADFKTAVSSVIDKDFTISKNTSIAGDTKTVTIALSGRNAVSAAKQEKLTDTISEKFKDNKIELYDSNSVSPSVASSFLIKSLVAVLLTALLVVIYVGFRFRRIGGVSAALTAFAALIIDLIISFIACVVFGLQIDSNYMAVVLTILGYSLNDTIVVYDRVRENKRLYPDATLEENVNMSIKGIITRNIVTTTTTVVAVLTIVVVSELYGLSSLRSFAIPMVFGLISGCVSSLFISTPLWVVWNNFKAKHISSKKKK